uniref:EAL domain-containing protein n=1 Tax=Okeania sp. SIO2F4 TaxID=2607790 RepID=UPI0025D9F93F|nr:EAL domain-containing protein [Okeania sp. SIO2F4]
MKNKTQVTEKITQIRERNIKISLDDFGTGYYSLNYLHRFPINTLKVDQSFIRRIGDRNGNLEIVQGIITLTHTLNMDIIPEGIEIDFHLT